MKQRKSLGVFLVLLCFLIAPTVKAGVREERVPLKNGTLHVRDLSSAVCKSMDLPAVPLGSGDVDVRSPRGNELLNAVNLSLGRTGSVEVVADSLVLRVDRDRVGDRCEQLSRAVRILAAEADPAATARQAKRWGLFFPENLDSSRPLIVLIHGLDSDRGMLAPMADLLIHNRFQVGYFSYPGDQPVDDSIAAFSEKLAQFHALYPQMKLDIVAHSMGGLVARGYVESDRYTGGVDRLIMIGTPNGGSTWSKLRFLLSLQQHYNLWRNDPDWALTWYVTEGFGEAGRDLSPGSKFLTKMAAMRRRAGVRYTLIAGTQHPASRLSAECFEGMSGWIGGRPASWWGFRQCKTGLNSAASHFRHETGDGDGPVSLASAKLAGVKDVVLAPADHIALFCPVDGHPAAAWAAVLERLRNSSN